MFFIKNPEKVTIQYTFTDFKLNEREKSIMESLIRIKRGFYGGECTYLMLFVSTKPVTTG